MDYIYYISFYLAVINIVSIVFTVVDKKAAIKRKRRISEKTLILLAALGGGIAMYITMIGISHKTKHKKFMIGVPVVVTIEAMMLITIYNLVKVYA